MVYLKVLAKNRLKIVKEDISFMGDHLSNLRVETADVKGRIKSLKEEEQELVAYIEQQKTGGNEND